jgi:hypothetical protein
VHGSLSRTESSAARPVTGREEYRLLKQTLQNASFFVVVVSFFGAVPYGLVTAGGEHGFWWAS